MHQNKGLSIVLRLVIYFGQESGQELMKIDNEDSHLISSTLIHNLVKLIDCLGLPELLESTFLSLLGLFLSLFLP